MTALMGTVALVVFATVVGLGLTLAETARAC
jgi:hypothetical protein